MTKDLSLLIAEIYPELNSMKDDYKELGIYLRDDGDGIQYIAEWTYSKPLPDGMKVGKN
jgi:hypothetical protein